MRETVGMSSDKSHTQVNSIQLLPTNCLSVFDNFVVGRYRGRYSSTEKRNMYLAFITLIELFTKMAFSVRLF